ncbi:MULTISPECIES: hypothetical protein [unclassified Streptomyces]|uniref:hypothetical protein n=1 Tax=unclassified Streptomyces TaxID=2593676 RepID=UPI000B2F2E2A|nr:MULTISPECIES: hypothetical protein [unclassified Streptomyces]
MGIGRRIDNIEDGTRGHPWGTLIAAFLAVYLLIGIVMTVTGSSARQAWLAPLPVLLVVGAGIGVTRARRR